MKEPTMEEVLELVDFQRSVHGTLYVHTVKCSVEGNVVGNVKGRVCGKINGRSWQYVETPKGKAIRLIRERRYEEAIMALEESDS
jgi:hypothetical protein